jgi:hypothetical protein
MKPRNTNEDETMTTATASRFVIKGINDEQDSCSCCGKTGLKRVVWIEDTETGDINHFGTSCATQPAKCFGISKSEINSAVRKFEASLVAKQNADRYAKMTAAIEAAEIEYTGGWIKKESPLVPGMFFTLAVNPEAFAAIRKKHIDAIV